MARSVSRRCPSRELLAHIAGAGCPTSARELEELLRSFVRNRKGRTRLLALDSAASSQFYTETLPWIVDSATRLHDVVPVDELPLLDRPGMVELTGEQTAAILANMFLCTFNQQDSLEVEAEKLKCFIHYFDRLRLSRDESWRSRKVYFRRTASGVDEDDAASAPSTPMSRLIISSGGIEDHVGVLHADFANSYLGGGVFVGGSVQEEILFSVCPELCAGMLFCSRMQPSEAIVMTGAERFSLMEGYAGGIRWGGPCEDAVPLAPGPASDASVAADWQAAVRRAVEDGVIAPGTRLRAIVAMDAIRFPRRRSVEELKRANLLREFRKYGQARAAFEGPTAECGAAVFSAVATGNWGCGAFSGTFQIKALIQWIAASIARRDMIYCPFNETSIHRDLERMEGWVRERRPSAGEMWRALITVADMVRRETPAATVDRSCDLYELVRGEIMRARAAE